MHREQTEAIAPDHSWNRRVTPQEFEPFDDCCPGKERRETDSRTGPAVIRVGDTTETLDQGPGRR